MYKLIIVDDEEEVRKGVLRKIDWQGCGFEIAGEAENGREVLEIAEKCMPDVVLTDIKMPFMDGLKLSEHLREKFPTVKIIILTGFDEFEYAQKALRLNAVEYILKPISAQELTDVLNKVKNRIDEEIAQKEDMQVLKEHYRRSLPVLREKFLTTLITSRLKKDEVLERLDKFDLNLNGSTFLISVLSIDYRNEDQKSMAQKDDRVEFNLPDDIELLKLAVLNISEEISSRHNLGMVFIHNEYIVYISSCKGNKENILTRTHNVIEEIRQSVQKFLSVTVTIGVGTVCDDITYLSYSYRNAVSALDYRLILGCNRIIFIEDIEPESIQKIIFDELKEQALARCIKVGTDKEIEETVNGLFEEIKDMKVSIKDYQLYLLEILTTILKAAKGSNVNIDNIFGSDANLLVEVYQMNSIQEVKNWILGICKKITSCVTNEREDSCKLIVQKAKDYVRSKYFESDITINKICKYLHISPTYFSSIFKRETKMTFMNYLLNIRMEAAKELLRSTNMKTFEIAEKVGYSEPNYFSYCFKKNLGLSPSEYRHSN